FGPRLVQLTSGGAPLPRHVCEGIFAAGIPLLEGYGLTESSPVIAFNSIDSYRIGTVGKPIPDVEVQIAEDGEILTRGPHIMPGYWKNDAATAESIIDGWLHTGDIGHLDDDGYLSITDRKKDLIITSGGKNIAPSVIERLIVSDPFIDQAVLYGDGRQFLSALLVPNYAEVAKELDRPIQSDDDSTFLDDEAVLQFLQGRIDGLMTTVSQPERVRKILVLARAFQVQDDELTATLKVRRRHIIQKYETELSGLYA
ncbi:MAG: AMP-binding protein, partial [Planctomycetota bacterium]|nr:AMP-binding protein [Planctomycetota bacterium]